MDIKDMLSSDISKHNERKNQVRMDFPICTSMADIVRDAFGHGVKARHFVENGKEIGRPVAEGNVDGFRLADMDESLTNFRNGYKKAVDKKNIRR